MPAQTRQQDNGSTALRDWVVGVTVGLAISLMLVGLLAVAVLLLA
jgi:hypothetical protein